MDKVFKINKNDLVSNFKIACDKLEYKEIEINPVTDSITYKALGKGLQWGTNAVVKVVFVEKEGFTNAAFEVIKEIRFPKFGKQKLAEKFYKEIIGLVEVLNESKIKANQSFNDTKPETNSVSNKKETEIDKNPQISSSNSKNDSENIKAYLDKNEKKKNNKILIFGGVFILVLIITQLTNSSSSSSSSINACECSERWLATPKSTMKGSDKWKYDACERKFGGWAGAHSICND